ncbi:IclR family transcriptional regulator C-terminal domain-containing protein [Streptomyces sp. NPDC056544]|uniref:IclR family transcriptional regulator domain-containing protein n=1 Tax=unclassified Streptomyces TaxID=2593676 RepID=UPI0036A73201
MSQAQPSWSPRTSREGENHAEVRYDVQAAFARLLASAASQQPLAEPSGVGAGEEAGRELEALCVSVVLAPQASSDIALLAADNGLSTVGAVAFGCLLHLAGEEAAGFWWEFAAGAGEWEAAYLLMLDHRRRVELRDAAMWADRLTAALEPPRDGLPTGPRWHEQPALTAQMRHSLRRAARYAELHEHEDLGGILLPTPRLAKALFALADRPHHTGTGANPSLGCNDHLASADADLVGASGSNVGGVDLQGLGGDTDPAAAGASAPQRMSAGQAAKRLWTPPPARPRPGGEGSLHAPAEWEDSLRVLDVLQLIRESGCVETTDVARTAGITPQGAEELLAWLTANGLTRPLNTGTHGPGPLLIEIARGNSVLQSVLDQLRDDTGAAVYISTYTDGEIAIPHLAWGPDAPQVTVTVDFKETAHASAVGKSLLSQLPPDGRADLLSRHQPKPLTARTITDTVELIDTIDRYGPQSAYFDVFEYSDAEVCVALSLPLANQACSVALSLPVAAHHRLLEAAQTLSDRSTGLLLALVLATNPTPPPSGPPQPTPKQTPAPAPAPAPSGRLWTPSPPPFLTPHIVNPSTRLIITSR